MVKKAIRVEEVIGVVSNGDEILVVMSVRAGENGAETLGLVFSNINEAIAEVEYLLKVLEAKREQLARRRRSEENDGDEYDW